jgi:hypothetical protein
MVKQDVAADGKKISDRRETTVFSESAVKIRPVDGAPGASAEQFSVHRSVNALPGD